MIYMYVNFYQELVHLTFILRNLMFILSTIKCELIKQLYDINLWRLPSQHGEVSIMSIEISASKIEISIITDI